MTQEVKGFSVSIKPEDVDNQKLISELKKKCKANAMNFSAHVLQLIRKGLENG